MRISPIVILDCRRRGSYLYDCKKFALYGLSYPGWYRTEYYCGDHLREAVMNDAQRGNRSLHHSSPLHGGSCGGCGMTIQAKVWNIRDAGKPADALYIGRAGKGRSGKWGQSLPD